MNPYNYSHFKPHKNAPSYYIPNPKMVLDRGHFRLEDTDEIFVVTGIKPNVQPICLEFEPHDSSYGFLSILSIPKAFRVSPDFLSKEDMML